MKIKIPNYKEFQKCKTCGDVLSLLIKINPNVNTSIIQKVWFVTCLKTFFN